MKLSNKMDCSTTDEPTDVVSPGKDSSSSDDDIPLSKLLTRPRGDEKKLCENARSFPFSTNTNSKKDKSASDGSSDNKALIKIKTISASAKKPVKKDNASRRSNGTNNKKADLNTDDSSDNEPLIKIAKVSSKVAKKPFSVPPVHTNKKESLDGDDGSDDEPLSKLAKKPQRKKPAMPSRKATPVMKSKRNATRKKVKYAESSSNSSDDEPLAAMKRKLKKAPKEQKTNGKKTQPKDKSLKDCSSDDDVPLVNLITNKKKPVKKNTKTTTVSQGSASRKRQGLSGESSDEEPLINLVEKNRTGNQTKTKTKASSPKKDTTPKKPRKTLESGSSSNSSDNEPLIKAAKHPQVTKILRIILERCDGEEAVATGSQNQTSTDTTTAEKTPNDESESSEESPEEE